MTASIDVYLGEMCILRTGGQFKMTGSQSTTFVDENSEHHVVLRWGRVRRHRFPYQLQIDGVDLDDAHVGVENWRMACIPSFIILASVVWLLLMVCQKA
jgi:hypothetical protein